MVNKRASVRAPVLWVADTQRPTEGQPLAPTRLHD